jgi:uncharacterized protein with GYD domain
MRQEMTMPMYITLLQYTAKGIESIKQSPGRVDAARQAFRQAGADFKALYLTMGQYDLVALIEAPNDEAMARAGLALGSQGNVRTQTMRAFTEDEFKKIVGGLP